MNENFRLADKMRVFSFKCDRWGVAFNAFMAAFVLGLTSMSLLCGDTRAAFYQLGGFIYLAVAFEMEYRRLETNYRRIHRLRRWEAIQ